MASNKVVVASSSRGRGVVRGLPCPDGGSTALAVSRGPKYAYVEGLEEGPVPELKGLTPVTACRLWAALDASTPLVLRGACNSCASIDHLVACLLESPISAPPAVSEGGAAVRPPPRSAAAAAAMGAGNTSAAAAGAASPHPGAPAAEQDQTTGSSWQGEAAGGHRGLPAGPQGGLPSATAPVVQVWCAEARRHRFLLWRPEANVWGSPYHLREPETRRLAPACLSDFAATARCWRGASRVFGQADVGAWHWERAGQADSWHAERAQVAAMAPGARTWLQELVDWQLLGSCLEGLGYGQQAVARLDMGTEGGVLPTQYCTQDRLLLQVVGRRRVLLVPPEHVFEGLYPYPLLHPYDTYSMVDFAAPNTFLWPKFSQVKGRAVTLEAGDLLHIPEGWFAHMQMLAHDDVVLELQLPSQHKVSRVVERWVGQAVGAAAVRDWLQHISLGEELLVADAGMPQGYLRVKLAAAVRKLVGCQLGAGRVAGFLEAVCMGRLVPTPWLNQDFREPLYLADTPRQVEVPLSQEQRRYPALFRQQIERVEAAALAAATAKPAPHPLPVAAERLLLTEP